MKKQRDLITNKLISLVLCFLILASPSVLANKANENIENIEQNVAKIESFLRLEKENLPHQTVLNLTSHIIKKRRFYDQTTIAKAYVLLADIAINRGDLAKAFQFAQDGLGLNITEQHIRLNLLLKTVSGYYAKGKFQQVKTISEQILSLAKDETSINFRLKALGYRAVVFALIVDYPNALKDLQQIEKILDEHNELTDHIELLEILATAHHYLGDYETAISIHLKLLNMRYKSSNASNIGNSYYALASAYRQLNRLDDAYDAFWQAKQVALTLKSPIKSAYAELGLGEVLLKQEEYHQALEHLIDAEKLFNGRNLSKPYLSTLIALAKTQQKLKNTKAAHQLLIRAKLIAQHIELTIEQTELYQLLSEMYAAQNKQQQAWEMLNKYITVYREFNQHRQSYIEKQFEVQQSSQHNRKVTLQLALKSELQTQYADKIAQKEQRINTLIIVILGLIGILIFILLKYRRQQINDLELPIYSLANSSQTKQIYQKSYKMARKFQYPLSIGYLLIHNWHDLTYKCNKKELTEVKHTIATVINEYKGEFDLAGLLNEGEYLLIFPHQNSEQVKKLVIALNEALKVRFFANLGEIAVNINYALDTLTAQDIDPFIFLSHLTESIKKSSD